MNGEKNSEKKNENEEVKKIQNEIEESLKNIEESERTLRKRNSAEKLRKVILILLWIIFLIAFTAIAWLKGGLLIGSILTVALVVAAIISEEYLIRQLADVGLFWVRVPENTALAIMKDRRLDTMLIAVPGEMRMEWKKFCDKKNAAAGREKFVLLEKQGGLRYIGRPWVYTVYEWYESSIEEKKAIKALHSVDLGAIYISYLSADPNVTENDPEGVPNFESGDPTEVVSALTVSLSVTDPEKSLFVSRYRKEAIKKQIFAIWRVVLSELSFYEYTIKDSGEKEEIVRLKILRLSNQNLRMQLGLLEEIGGEIKKPDIYKESSVVSKFEKKYGIHIEDVMVDDLQEKGGTIRDALEKRLQAKAVAFAKVEEAKGESEKIRIIAEANKNAKRLDGEGEALRLEKIAEALKANPEVITLEQIKGWNGQLPQFMGNGPIPFFNIENLKKDKDKGEKNKE